MNIQEDNNNADREGDGNKKCAFMQVSELDEVDTHKDDSLYLININYL